MRLKYLSAIAGLSFLFTACVKEKGNNLVNQDSPASTTVDFPNQTETAALNIQAAPTIYTFYAEINAVDKNKSGVTVTITKNASIVAAGGYEFLPDSAYQLVNTTATADPTTGLAAFQLRVNTTKIDLSKNYAVGFTIASTTKGVIAINKNNVVIAVGAKNQYDGIYSILSGTVTRYTAPGVPANDALSGSVAGNPDLTLSTINANTVEITNLKWAGGSSSVAGIDNLRLTVDPATNLVTMTALGNATLANWPARVNKYDPATRTFTLAFRWNPTANVREYEMVIKYKGPR